MNPKKSQVKKNCLLCGVDIVGTPHSMKKKKFCSRECANAHQTGERKSVACETCKTIFKSKKDHGSWQRFCSRKCFRHQTTSDEKVKIKNCPSCGKEFKAHYKPSKKAHADYCSVKCRGNGQRSGKMLSCAFCKKEFYTHNCIVAKGRKCCSWECRNKYFVGEHATAYIDGTTTSNGVLMVACENPTKNIYWAEHRLFVSNYIGRLLTSTEVVVHINGYISDNKLDNLYVCLNRSEWSSILTGSIPWPKDSNLDMLRENQKNKPKQEQTP